MKKHGLLTAALLLPAAMSFAGGFQLNLQGLRQMAMGGGGVAYPWDASTLFYNPGGLSRLNGLQVYGSVHAIIPRVRYVGTGFGTVTESTPQTFLPFNVYVGGTIKNSRLGFGVGIYTPFGSGIKWDDNWTGRYVTQSIELRTFFLQPTLSYRVSDNISVGAGFVYAFGDVSLSRAIPTQFPNGSDGKAELNGDANGIGYNVGISLKATERLSFGISYRSRVDMKADDGTAKFTVPSSLSTSFPASTSFSTKLRLPDVLSVGMAVKPLEHFTVSLDFNVVGWRVYDSLIFDYKDNTAQLADTRAARLYKNQTAVRLGGHYQATDRTAFMLGVAYDPSPVRDNYVSPDLPDANRIVLSGGFTVKPVRNLTIMAALEYVTSEKRKSLYSEANFGGRYQTKALTPALGITYDFR